MSYRYLIEVKVNGILPDVEDDIAVMKIEHESDKQLGNRDLRDILFNVLFGLKQIDDLKDGLSALDPKAGKEGKKNGTA